jgi:CheY-like chemotaxis protein
MLCQAWGYETLVFESGQHVWEWLDDVEAGHYKGPLPGFALMDIRMPGKKGNEVAYRIRSLPVLQHIPIVLMTAFSLNENQRNEMMRDGADEIINKPLPDFDKLDLRKITFRCPVSGNHRTPHPMPPMRLK